MAAGLGRVLVLDRGALKDERWVFRQAEGRAREPQEGCLPLCAISFPSSTVSPFSFSFSPLPKCLFSRELVSLKMVIIRNRSINFLY